MANRDRREPSSSQGKRPVKEEPLRGNTPVMQGTVSVSTKQQRIAQVAREKPEEALSSLHHQMDEAWMLEAWRRTRRDGATGVDGQSAEQYASNLRGKLVDLLERCKSGRYQAPPVRRVHIPKGDGTSTRPIGIPTLEDKVMQRAIVMLLEPIYEAEFRTCSFGFRPGKSAHDALEHLWKQSMGAWGERPVRWMLDVDIKAFFDALVHRHLRQVLDRRVRDGVVRRMIDKWLKAGVMEEGVLSYAENGTPQGGVISPLLSNIYLHEVLDLWFEQEVQPRMKGRAFLVRYADDFVIGFEYEEDARRVQAVLPKRFARYGLTLHPEKTRLVPFTPPVRQAKQDKGTERRPPNPGDPQVRSFDFLGFTHYWGWSRKGQPVIQRQTARKRLTRALGKLREWMRANRHEPVRAQWQTLKAKLRGHYAYYGIRGNGRGVSRFGYEARRAWFKWLNRRGGRKALTWDRFGQWLTAIFVWPEPRIYHRPHPA
jgi:RNA-directed DNA polymerase